ncbi:hypothetical protein HK099_000388 [Clydaea vesicula]|uniref:Importin N-terminal domain-containing protein n=1 Tax=Clydaea vesicula TaxID=447962 RepID=A0AAD5U821_9FUNG|nr:hypothetical protein HK099_000388 [Clydaea vesicula]
MVSSSNGLSELYSILSMCLSNESNQRINAEQALQLKKQSEVSFPVNLIHIATSQPTDIAIRQLSLVTLKSYVTYSWSSTNFKFTGPETPENIKTAVKNSLLPLLADPLSKIRVQTAQVISKIATTDFPESWPNLLEDLIVKNLKNGNQFQIHGSMRCLADLINCDLSEDQIMAIAPTLLPELQRIFGDHKNNEPSVRQKAVVIFEEIIKALYNMKETHKSISKNYVQPLLTNWFPVFFNCLQDTNDEVNNMSVKIQVIQTLLTIRKTFRREFSKEDAKKFFEVIYQKLVQTSLTRVEQSIDDVLDSDGEITNTDNFISTLLDFILVFFEEKSIKNFFFTNSGNLVHLLEIFIHLTKVDDVQLDIWMENVDEFLNEENELSFNFFLRKKAYEVYCEFMQEFGVENLLPVLEDAINKALWDADQKKHTDKNCHHLFQRWKVHEAVMYLLAEVSEEVIETQAIKPHLFDLNSFFEKVVLVDAQLSGYPFLQGRAFSFSSLYAGFLQPDTLTNFITFVVQMLMEEKLTKNKIPKILKCLLIKSLSKFIIEVFGNNTSNLLVVQGNLRHLTKDILEIFLEFCIESSGLREGFDDEVSVERLSCCIEGLRVSSGMNKEITAMFEKDFSKFIVSAWAKYIDDVFISEMLLDFFESLTKNELVFKNLEESFITSVLPLLDIGVQILGNSETFKGEKTFMFCGVVCPVENLENMFSNGQFFLESLLNKNYEGILNLKDTTVIPPKSGLDYLVLFLGKILDPNLEENSAFFVGDVITKLILKSGGTLNNYLPDLLKAVSFRLSNAKIPSLIQNLIMVFAHLIAKEQYDLEIIINFLYELKLFNDSYANGLDMLIKIWSENQSFFFGFFDIKVSLVALTKLYGKADPRLRQIFVKGDLKLSNDLKIKTRSRARQLPDEFEMISFPGKVIKLLIENYQINQQVAMNTVKSNTNGKNHFESKLDSEDELTFDSEEEGWEDDDDFTSKLSSKNELFLKNFQMNDVGNFNYESEDSQENTFKDKKDKENAKDPLFTLDLKVCFTNSV